MNIHEVETTMLRGTHAEKINLLYHLDDVFESYNNNIENFKAVLELLIQFAIATEDEEIRDSILERICTAETYQDVSHINFDPIEEYLENFSSKDLAKGIEILSYTYNKKYVTTILKYQNHQDEIVRESVKDALIELGN